MLTSADFDRDNYITQHELCEAINTLCHFIDDQHGKDAPFKVRDAVAYLDKAMADKELVMAYYP
jgi:hypothetical protein